jgi:hypothetical protein
MKTSPLPFVLLLVAGLTLVGCSDGGKIPVDREQAQVHIISEGQARTYVNSFKQGRLELARHLTDSTFLRDTFNLPDAEMFNRHAIALLLNQEGAEGVRIYLGRDSKGQIRLVLLPVDKNGKNIVGKLFATTAYIPGVSSAYADENGEAIENGQRCPTMCDEGW